MKIYRVAMLVTGLSLAGLSAWACDMETSKSDSGIPFAEAAGKTSNGGGTVQGRYGLKSMPKGMSQAASAQAPVVVPLPAGAQAGAADGRRVEALVDGLSAGLLIGGGAMMLLATTPATLIAGGCLMAAAPVLLLVSAGAASLTERDPFTGWFVEGRPTKGN